MFQRFLFAATTVTASIALLAACGGSDTGTGGSGTTASSSSTGLPPEPAFNVQNISVSADGRSETETHVAVSKDGVLAAAWIGQTTASRLRIGYTFSTDGGKTWTAPATASPGGTDLYGDPTLIAADDGSFYLAFLGFDGGFTKGAIYVAKAAAGSTTFDAAVRVTPATEPGPYDKPIIALTKNQTVVVSYTNIATSALDLARSTDGGASFTRTHVLPTSVASLPYTCTDPTSDRVWVVFHNGVGISLKWSEDDGATFPAANLTTVSLKPGENDVSTDDTVCVGKGNDVWIAYALSKDTTNPSNFLYKDYSIRLAHSPDGGATIDSRIDVQDAGGGMYSMEPALALEPNGAIDLSYVAGNGAPDPAGSLRWARSVDAGQTFGASTALATPITFDLNRSAPNWLGDYFGFVATNDRIYATYADNQTGVAHVSFASSPVVP